MTSSVRALPESGYRLIKTYTTHFEASHATPSDPKSGSQSMLHFGTEWRKVSEQLFDVSVRIKIDPSASRPERAEIHLVGQFEATGEPQISMEQFAKQHAVAILFPYVRQLLTTATASSYYGPFYLPVVNIPNLLQGTSAVGETDKRAGHRLKAVPRSRKRAVRRPSAEGVKR